MSDRLRYEVIVEGNNEEGYSAFLPSLLGCVTAAGSIEEIKRLIVEAVDIHIEGMLEDNLAIPEPLSPEQAEEAFGMPIPDSVAPGLFVEVSVAKSIVPIKVVSRLSEYQAATQEEAVRLYA